MLRTEALTLKELKEALEYFPETGKWVNRKYRSWKARAGMEAGGMHPDGYIQIKLWGVMYLAHRLAVLYMTGTPAGENVEVDHVNGDRTDNRWSNLRLVDNTGTAWNRGVASNNTSGYSGVTWWIRGCKWQAKLGYKGKRIHLGYYDDVDEAGAAVKAARERLYGEFARRG